MNYRLSLAGVAGLIVAIGLIADSFIVYFERVRDELRDGRSLASAVDVGWSRAKRTILASKAVNVLAAIVLYLVAVGNVRGFAFTLGLTAIIDLIVVYGLTHPTLMLLARTKFFADDTASPVWIHRCLARCRYTAVPARCAALMKMRRRTAARRTLRRAVKAAKRLTIAERRRAEANREENNE